MTATIEQPDAEAAEANLAAICEFDLIQFVRRAWPVVEPASQYIHNWHLSAICDHLAAVSRRQIRKLLIMMPPRHAKSLTVGVFWPAWEWGPQGRPETRWLFASYAQALSTRDAVRTRRLIESPWYKKFWGHTFAMTGDQNLKMRYDNDHTGCRLSTSVGGSLTGEGGDIIVIDDPHNVIDGESEVMREGCLEWWDQAMSTRLNDPKTGAYVVIQQRIHENDLAGHIMAKEHGWDVLILPAEYEKDHPVKIVSSLGFTDPRTTEGELLWEKRLGRREIADIKERLGPTGAAAQLQQRPSPAGGGLFKREYFRYYRDEQDWYTCLEPDGNKRKILKVDCWRFIMADTAMTEKTTSDYTARGVWDVEKIATHDGNGIRGARMFFVDLWCERATVPVVERQLRNDITRFKPLFIGVEDKVSGTGIIQQFREEGLPVRGVKADKDKVTRARAAEVMMSNGKVYFPHDAPWLSMMESQLLTFPMSENDDIVDMIAHSAAAVLESDRWVKPAADKLRPGTFGHIMYGKEETKDDWQKGREKVWR